MTSHLGRRCSASRQHCDSNWSAPQKKLPQPVAELPWGHNITKPIGVAEWETKIVETLPDNLKGSLPTVEEIEAELAEVSDSVPQAPRRKR
jgi:hypothetical protein